mmetsp:Transcript_42847/g.70756  ORF Transcript_42847/g.70756 Transcript_42847/m.70756 type:complete len:209 (-) Transcript_42847:1053-1679(-)
MRAILVLRIARPTCHHRFAHFEQHARRFVHKTLRHVSLGDTAVIETNRIRHAISVDRNHSAFMQLIALCRDRLLYIGQIIGVHTLIQPKTMRGTKNVILRRGDAHIVIADLFSCHRVGTHNQVECHLALFAIIILIAAVTTAIANNLCNLAISQCIITIALRFEQNGIFFSQLRVQSIATAVVANRVTRWCSRRIVAYMLPEIETPPL